MAFLLPLRIIFDRAQVNRKVKFSAFYVGLLLILSVSALMFLLSYKFSLPYIDHPDEPNIYYWAQEWRGLFQNQRYIYNYPPGYIGLAVLVQTIAEPLGVYGVSANVQI